ncbi:MAG: CCA tRNA nucleotidyltransferase [Candidatus Omnitrophota bacterium]
MKKYLAKLPKEMRDLICLTGEVAELRRMRVYLVGGFVRDLMLKVKNFDLDVVVEGDGITFAEDLAARLKARLIKHHRFCTATVIAGRGLKIDVATARNETYPEPAALPVVEPGCVKEDLKRRDFTINAMAIDISGCRYGSLVDFFHGKQDLAKKKIRILHDKSFIDDPTRMLRAVRFEQRYGFRMEPQTIKLLKAAKRRKMLEKVQPQRVRDELILMLKEKYPIIHLKRLSSLVGLRFISPRLKLAAAGMRLLKAVEEEINWYKRTYSHRRPLETWLMYLMALTDSLRVPAAQQICKDFALRKGEEKRIISLKKLNRKFILELAKPGLKPSRIFRLLEPLSYETILLAKAKYRLGAVNRHIEDFLEIYNGMRIYISGNHLRSLGIEPGPVYQKIFTKVLEAKLNGLIKTEAEELALIKELTKKTETS